LALGLQKIGVKRGSWGNMRANLVRSKPINLKFFTSMVQRGDFWICLPRPCFLKIPFCIVCLSAKMAINFV